MHHQRNSSAAARSAVASFVVCVLAVIAVTELPAQRSPAGSTTFDELYRRGQLANAGLKTLTAHFTETTTSALLTRPLVEQGTLAVERPAKVILNYTVPDTRTVLIDGDRLVLSWPGRNINQTKNIKQVQSRVQKYFVDSSPAELRKSFDIDVIDTERRAGTDHISLLPKRKQIREGLTRLDLWVDQRTQLLAAMRMTFANGDAKLMTLDNVVPNAVLNPTTFAAPHQTAR
jgi:outer membrane lipoprotein-sorting protein